MIDTPGPLVKVHVHGNAGTIVLNRPEKRNALSRAMLAQLSTALHDMHMQKSAKAVVISGAGPAFCAGMDLVEMSETTGAPDAYEWWERDARAYRDVVETMLRFPKPIIAAVDGPAVAGGAGLLVASDIVIASDTATFGLPEPRRGLVAGMVAPLLYFRIGGSRAAYLLLTATALNAEQAREIGLFHEIVRPEQVWARANEIADQCAACAPEALALTKRMLNENIGDHMFTMLGAGTAISSAARTTEAAREGLAAFLEKRKPDWK